MTEFRESLQRQLGCGTVSGISDRDAVEVSGDPAVGKNLRRLREDFLVLVPSGDVGQD